MIEQQFDEYGMLKRKITTYTCNKKKLKTRVEYLCKKKTALIFTPSRNMKLSYYACYVLLDF